jgi:hypothetical protein
VGKSPIKPVYILLTSKNSLGKNTNEKKPGVPGKYGHLMLITRYAEKAEGEIDMNDIIFIR